ncbi:MAG TPA: alpha/beta hydrolase, partial [Tissierellaceae bacterium]|nr:alpha/beta hydrolase [Tissierellaceae bacterium]
MPKISIKGKDMYYEVYGQGEPLVILNGIMMSTGSWTSFIDVFSNKNKLVLVDFVDQGQSDKMKELY